MLKQNLRCSFFADCQLWFEFGYEQISFNNFFHIFVVVPHGKFIGETGILLRDVVAMLTLLTFINSCLNPVFYALYSK